MANKKPTQAMFFDENEEEEATKTKKPTQSRAQKPKKAPQSDEHETLGDGEHNVLKLPSKGKLGYSDKVEYRDILFKDEETLSMATPDTYVNTLNSVLKNILNGCEFFEDMALFDRDYLLVWLWANNYASVKEMEITCQHCGTKEGKKVDLSQTEVIDIKDNMPEHFTIPLKNADIDNVVVRLNTVQDELDAEAYMSKNPKANHEMVLLAASIELPYNIPLAQKIKWVRENVSGKELGYVRKFHRYFKFGVADTVEHVCSECQGVTQTRLPFHPEDILFPTVQTDFEDLLRFNEGDETES